MNKYLSKVTAMALLIIAAALANVVTTSAQTYSLRTSVVGSGGVMMATNGKYQMWSTLGQPTIGRSDRGEDKLVIGFWAEARDYVTKTATSVEEQPVKSFELLNNSPNPVTGNSTRINYTVKTPGFVTITIYDLVGRAIRTLVSDYSAAGEGLSVEWDVRDESGMEVNSGAYMYELAVRADNGDVVRVRQQLSVVR
ncbi:MAG TPA: hypothetical protein PLW09_11445 [Candidatus Kapabacteria bacterium]|nr:hypothetical protein [Candidatus Kapabacteria bacterium]